MKIEFTNDMKRDRRVSRRFSKGKRLCLSKFEKVGDKNVSETQWQEGRDKSKDGLETYCNEKEKEKDKEKENEKEKCEKNEKEKGERKRKK